MGMRGNFCPNLEINTSTPPDADKSRLPLDRPSQLEGTFQNNLRPSLFLEGVRVLMRSWILYFLSSAAAVSNSWGLGGVEEAPGGITNWTKHPKWGQSLSLFFSFPPDSDGSSSEGKTCIQIVPSHFWDFLFTAGQGLGFIFHPFVRRKMHHKPWKPRAGLVLPPLTFLHL